jgi:hypothetical protein
VDEPLGFFFFKIHRAKISLVKMTFLGGNYPVTKIVSKFGTSMIHPCTFRPHTLWPWKLYPDIFTSPYVSSLKCRVRSIPEKTLCHWKRVRFVPEFFIPVFSRYILLFYAISPILTVLEYSLIGKRLHCKEKIENFSSLLKFFSAFFTFFRDFHHKPIDWLGM